MVVQAKAEDWEAFAESYNRIAEAVVRKPVTALLETLDTQRPFKNAVGVLDNGSGPATIMSRLIETYGPVLPTSCSLTCTDYTPSMVKEVVKIRDGALAEDVGSAWARVEGKVLDALDLHEIESASQSHVAAGLLYNLTNDPAKCLAECRRVLQPTGVLAVSSWECNDWIEMLRVVPLIRPEFQASIMPKWSTADTVRGDLERAGFRDVCVQRIHIQIPFTTHKLFVDTVMQYQPRMVSMLKSFTEEEKAQLEELLMEEIRMYCPSQPGTLNGVVLVGAGQLPKNPFEGNRNGAGASHSQTL